MGLVANPFGRVPWGEAGSGAGSFAGSGFLSGAGSGATNPIGRVPWGEVASWACLPSSPEAAARSDPT